MENISRIKEKCVGCKSCEQSCPKHCISMVENKEGFWYPSVDEKNCIECKVCLKKCPVENTEFHRNKAFDEKGIGYAKTAVGDKYVYEYMQSTGKKYTDHAATLRSWSARKKRQQKPGTGIPDYTYSKEESL